MKQWFLNLWNDESKFRVFGRSVLLAAGGAFIAYPQAFGDIHPLVGIGCMFAAGLMRSKSMHGPEGQ